jgi:hypothetical protein
MRVVEEYWRTVEKFMDTLDSAASVISDINIAAEESAGADLFTLVHSIVFYPEMILIFLLLFVIFSSCTMTYYWGVTFTCLAILSVICFIRAALYPLPNLFLIDDFYLCDIYGGYVKGIFYLLLSIYILMIHDRNEFINRAA